MVTTGDFSRHLTPNFHNLLQELRRRVELTVWHHSGDINTIMEASNSRPDFILINEYGETNSPDITGLDRCQTPCGVLLHDLHYAIAARRKMLEQNKVKHIFTLYRDKFYEWYPQYWDKVHWLPHQIDPGVFKDYGQDKEIDCLMMGAVHAGVYPLRTLILNTMRDTPGFVYHQHPGYRNFSDQEAGEAMIWENYAREINRARLFVTCYSRYAYPLAKYLEVLACNTLLLAPASREIEELGLIPGTHFAAINDTDFKEKIRYYLEHDRERERIARQGHDLVHSRHTTGQRVTQLLDIIRTILAGS